MADEMKIAQIGFGTVGGGFIDELNTKRKELENLYDLKPKVVAIADKYLGSVYDPEGLDLDRVLELQETGKENALSDYKSGEHGLSSVQSITETNADTIGESTWTNIEDGEPGLTHIKTALKNGKNVVTSNKGPFGVDYNAIKNLAESNNVHVRFEATVLAGTPALNLIREDLAGCEIKNIKGIVNGTTNYILTKMEEKSWEFDKALKKAQELGYAEEDPSADIEGWDPAVKASILSSVVFNKDITPQKVDREGIKNVNIKDVKELKDKRLKLIAEVQKVGDEVKAEVKPKKIPLNDPLAQIKGATNALTIETDHLGQIMIKGPGAGKKETGQALLNDLIKIHIYKDKGKSFRA